MCLIMPADAELDFADQVGRFFSHQYAMPPMAGRIVGWLLICEPPYQTVASLAESLRASRTAIGGAIPVLEGLGMVKRSRVAGERADRISLDPAMGAQESASEYVALAALAREGLEVLRDAPAARRARLLELAAFADFLVERAPMMAAEWRERRDALRASGELPDPS
jgi:DNA-binding MarR family transcriptional regulator